MPRGFTDTAVDRLDGRPIRADLNSSGSKESARVVIERPEIELGACYVAIGIGERDGQRLRELDAHGLHCYHKARFQGVWE